MEKGKHKILEDGKSLYCPGIDYGSKPQMVFWVTHSHLNREPQPLPMWCYAVVHVKGQMAWDGVGSPFRYFSAQWFLVEGELGADYLDIKTVLQRREPGRQWRKCRDELIGEAKQWAFGRQQNRRA